MERTTLGQVLTVQTYEERARARRIPRSEWARLGITAAPVDEEETESPLPLDGVLDRQEQPDAEARITYPRKITRKVPRRCVVCGVTFEGTMRAKYCCKKHANKFNNDKIRDAKRR